MSRSTRPQATRTDYVAETLRRRIVLGELEPGTPLRLDALTEQLDVSRVPLREALRELHAEGLAVTYPQRGAFVSDIVRLDVVDSFMLLKAVEVAAAERAVTERPDETARLMATRYETLSAVIHSDRDREKYLTAHQAFHFAVFESIDDSPALQRMARILWNSCERFLNAAHIEERIIQSDDEHQRLLTYMAAGDATAVRAITTMHVEHGAEAALHGLGFVADRA
ncbi:transcriptional regulator, GntR family [Pseudonocardia ammonioxydans]|uniref:Transcriptional regulator, GntR family n=1 Tax=Pseudonocardia ammonioxydans TaxID=260086 RepID=A0A1I5E9L4_PSUAM|nr:GntR family transcriptional regulator [Pseudonocardia ammonioxydans]SFO07771.1 transcriptional regulator, GntR family [Pseudonocardia ammonioxydans]